MIITIANAKGGTGKTTTAVYLSEVAARDGGNVTLLDADPQRSASDWAETARDSGTPLGFDVRPSDATELERLDADDGTLYVIDTQPGGNAAALTAIETADLVVVPCEAEPMSVRRMWRTLDLCGGKGAVLITKARPRTTYYKETLANLRDGGAEYFDTVIRDSMRYIKAFGTRPGNLADYAGVWVEIKEATGWR